MDSKFSTRMIAEIGVAVALAVVLNFLRLWRMPQGGSVSLEMLPILVIAFRWGVGAGMFSGFVYGMLQLVFGAYIIHPIQLLMDYPLPYMILGIAGYFKIRKDGILDPLKIFIAVIAASAARLVIHVLAGVIFFGHYAPEGQNVWAYSIIYNSSHLVPTAVVTFIVLLIVMKALERVNN